METDPTWWLLAGEACAALKAWDTWCPDDGRPLAAWRAAVQYAQAPAEAVLAPLVAAQAGVLAACEGAAAAYATGGADRAAQYAAYAADAVLALCGYWTEPGQNDWLAIVRQNIARAGPVVLEKG